MPLKQIRNGGYKYAHIPPVFKTTLEAQRFWANERKKWIEGWRDLTGRQYHFLTQGYIMSGTGMVMKPLYRFDDRVTFEALTKSDTTFRDTAVVSGRGVGKTVLLSHDSIYNSHIKMGCRQLVTACDLGRLGKFFKDKIDDIVTNMDVEISPSFRGGGYSNKQGYPERELKYGIKIKGQEKIVSSHIFGRQTSQSQNDVTNLSGSRGVRLTIEEPFLHAYLTKLLATGNELVSENGVRIGSILMAGTLEEESPQSAINELVNLLEVKDEIGMEVIFLPFHHGMNLRADGTSDVEQAIREWEETAERFDKMEDKTFLLNHKKNRPRTIADVITLSTEGDLPPEAKANIDEQKLRIKSEKVKIDRIIFGKTEKKLSSEGKILILEHPVEGVEYIAGTDPIQMINTGGTKGSKFVTIVMNPITMQPVALYAERNLNEDIVVHNVVSLLEYYNDAKNMVEANAGHVFFKAMIELHKTKLLARQPKKTGLAIKESAGKPLWGVRITSSKEATNISHALLVKYFLKYTNLIWFADILADVSNYPQENSDYIDALKCCLIYIKELEIRKRIASKNKMQKKEIVSMYTDHTGRKVYGKIIVEVPTNENN